MSFLDRTGAAVLAGVTLLACTGAGAWAAPAVVDTRMRIDQFGWRPGDEKLAVLSSPQLGFNAPDSYPAPSLIEVRRWDDDSLALSLTPSSWRGGAVHGQSGDATWSVDFSALVEEGSFYLWDPATGAGSHRFEVRDEVLAAVLDAALKAFLYQRCGTPKLAEHAGAGWADGACHVGPGQDLEPTPKGGSFPGPDLDLQGGWHDAGDYNKYVNFADGPVHDLLEAFREAPGAFTDRLGIPESGNGVPDILDEVRWELDWLLRMQADEGYLIHKVSVDDFSTASPPSADGARRYYSLASASATISGCGAFAHGATVFRSLGLPETDAYANTLEAAALAAWDWMESNPDLMATTFDNAGFQNAAAEDDSYSKAANRTAAAVYLAELTGEPRFHDHVDQTHRAVHLVDWGFVYPFEPEYQDALLLYTRVPGARAATTSRIAAAYLRSIGGADNLQHHLDEDDPYGAWLEDGNYVWGTNRTKSHSGLMYLLARRYALDPSLDDDFQRAGARYLHWLHGLNPLGLVFLTNMGAQGAEASCSQVYHGWFADGTDWDEAGVSRFGPPPGILPGGDNPQFAPDPSYSGPPLEPPQGQPDQKSYRDWNTSWPENSWEVTENQIAYQAAYVRLLANFVRRAAVPPEPVITRQPEAWSGCEGTAAFLDATATGEAPLRFQWRRDGLALIEGPPYSGTATAGLGVDPLSPSVEGLFDLVVTDALDRSVISEGALLISLATLEAIGDRLRLSREGASNALTWQATAGTVDYSVWRCDATAGPCVPAVVATTTATRHVVAETDAEISWFVVASQGACP